MKTLVSPIRTLEHRTMCGLIAKMIPHLSWRHSGLGVLQAYVHEGAVDEMRVHIWDQTLRRKGIEESGLIHDHRFELTSLVLVGMLRQVEYDLIPNVEGAWQTHTVVHAREAFNRHGSNNGLVSEIPHRYHVVQRERLINAGQSYTFPKREFHGTYVESDGFAITLIRKSHQDEAPARILAPWGKQVVHAFAETLPESEWQPTLHRATEALLQVWK